MVDISLIIPLYKGNRYCKRLLNMLDQNMEYLNQYQNCDIEVIFVNDYPDEDIQLDGYEHSYRIKLINQVNNKGIHASRVEGLKQAKGEYIIMLDQDDLVERNWLYSQWNKIKTEDAEYCVCNGWKGRFRTLWQEEGMKKRVNNIKSYLTLPNPIISPGQVIMKRKAIPDEWMQYIQHCNGSDDFLLWVMALKKEHSFILNQDYLFYHTPERTKDSVSSSQIMESNRETQKILNEYVLLQEEKELFSQYLESIQAFVDKKYASMFFITYNWIRLKSRGIHIHIYLKQNGCKKIAIYGMGYIGECLYDELRNTDIEILYGIDQNALDYKRELAIYHVDEDLEAVDGVIITIADVSNKIKRMVYDKLKCNIYTMDELFINMSECGQDSI
ncbi:glycosyltransferase family 2 protein [bacterium D16-54]|nr:glycosyltransferase family 2 protein [bacterium D16-54]RKJ09477.1 glycosyltransferase family 2 protein [bacterium D16-56]